MKRFFSYIGASLVAIAALSSCSKEIDNPSNEASYGIQFAITASSVDTKTSIDGFKTSWVANDQLDITHAIAGSTTYITDGSFSISEANLATNKFNGTLKSNLEEGSSYDWYALYPFTENDYTFIGHSKVAIQNGNNSTAHLCGTLCPLYGVAKNVNSSEPVSFDMQHLAAVVEITVTNETDADLTVKNITFASSDEDIVGSYIIDFKGDNVTYAASGEKYVSKVARLNVTNGDSIAKNGSAKFYIPIKPHLAEAGSKIVINVNGYEKEIPLTKDVTFKAGTVKKIGFKYDTKSTLYKIEFNNKSGSPSQITTTTKASTFVIAGAEYLETQPFSESTNAYYGGDKSNGLPLRIGKSDASGSITMALSKNGQINANKIIISAKQYSKGKAFGIGVNDSAKQKPGEDYTNLEFALDGSPLTSIKLDSDGYIYVQSITYLSAPVDNTTPSLSVDQTSKVWAADAKDAFVVKVTVNSEGGDWTVTPKTLSWATIAVDKAAGTITITPNGANETETANEATLTVTHTTDASLKAEVSLKQNGK
ncbi:MAG: fimbrillin family protein, partial [Bacteroides sp.]|nr:fimbrillin family protein [Bacteroides sp.]